MIRCTGITKTGKQCASGAVGASIANGKPLCAAHYGTRECPSCNAARAEAAALREALEALAKAASAIVDDPGRPIPGGDPVYADPSEWEALRAALDAAKR